MKLLKLMMVVKGIYGKGKVNEIAGREEHFCSKLMVTHPNSHRMVVASVAVYLIHLSH